MNIYVVWSMINHQEYIVLSIIQNFGENPNISCSMPYLIIRILVHQFSSFMLISLTRLAWHLCFLRNDMLKQSLSIQCRLRSEVVILVGMLSSGLGLPFPFFHWLFQQCIFELLNYKLWYNFNFWVIWRSNFDLDSSPFLLLCRAMSSIPCHTQQYIVCILILYPPWAGHN